MFRPYSLKSIALWTAGSLAGNKAYYSTKASYGGRRLSTPRVPANIQALARRTAAIEETFNGFCENAKTLQWAATKDQWDLTEFVRLFVFQEWITSRKAEIKAELRKAYEQSANRGSLWTESIAESYRNIDAFVDAVTALRNDISEIFSRAISTNSDREKLFDLIKKEQARYYVDELTYRVVSSGAAPLVVALKK